MDKNTHSCDIFVGLESTPPKTVVILYPKLSESLKVRINLSLVDD